MIDELEFQKNSTHAQKRVVIIGAGPVGIEAALISRREGYETFLLEAGSSVASHMRRWKHVNLFTPWSSNTTEEGRKILKRIVSQETWELFSKDDVYPRGREFIANYLEPLAEDLAKDKITYFNVQVMSVSRVDMRKNQCLGHRDASNGFVMLIKDLDGIDEYLFSDIVIDASGCYWSVIPPGVGGVPPIGYDGLTQHFEHEIPDIKVRDRERLLAASTVLVVGSGASAASTLSRLDQLYTEARPHSPPSVTWFVDSRHPIAEFENDPLPIRKQLRSFANRAAAGEVSTIIPIIGVTFFSVKEVAREGLTAVARKSYEIEYLAPELSQKPLHRTFDEVQLHTGFRPDLSITRELPIQYCSATESPIDLGEALIERQHSGAKNLAADDLNYAMIKTTEPNFFVVGAKSYGRNSTFLLSIGYRQISLIFNYLKDAFESGD